MSFNSLAFLIFFPIVCGLIALIKTRIFSPLSAEQKRRLRHIILLLASYVFYGWWNWLCCGLMLLMTVVAYICAQGHERSGKKLYVVLGVVFPLLVLGVFKYFNFFVDSFCSAFGIVRAGTLNILLPVGISFYTFQSLSYTIDVYRGRIKSEKDFVHLALYISFFPQLVAGPIVKAGEFIPQLYEDRDISLKNMELGLQYFVFGMFKKIVIADNISVFVDAVHQAPAAYSSLTLLLAAYAYAIQIYCDFSGYSDMAVGCARCLGYDLPRNFNLPYISKNVSEFWKRWHISLSTWLQEYVYISMGGNRRGRLMTNVNLFLTMCIGGLWHGAAWTFVLWGALHGAALCVHKYWRLLKARLGMKDGSSLGTAISVLITFTWVSLCLVVFRADSIGKAFVFVASIFSFQQGITHISFWAVFGLGLTALATAAAWLKSRKDKSAFDGFYPVLDLSGIKGLTIFFTFIGLMLALAYTGESPFIYFQF